MHLEIHWVSRTLVEVKVDEVNSGILNSDEAKELAAELIDLAGELLRVESKK